MIDFDALRARMVEEQLATRGLTDSRLLAAFRAVPRHRFVPEPLQHEAYADHPLPIGAGQTISQPYIVALMTGALRLQGHERVLEIGSGSGYQTAILAQLALEVYAVERIPELASGAAARLEQLGILNVHVTTGNGSLGWPEHAPYDAILLAAAAPEVPAPLLAQLGDPGVLVLPVGSASSQTLVRMEKHRGALTRTELADCLFVPLLGEHGFRAGGSR